MKHLITLLSLVMILITCSAEELTYSLSFLESEFALTTSEIDGVEYTELSHDKMAYENINNAYDLPVSVKVVSIPLYASNIEVSISTSEKKLLKSDCRLFPHQDAEDTGRSSSNLESQQIIIQNCTPHTDIINQGYYDGDNRVITVSVCPFEYDCATKKLYINQSCVISINYDNDVTLASSQYKSVPISRHNTGVSLDRINSSEKDIFLNNDILNLNRNNDRVYPKALPLTTFDSKLKAHEYMIITSKDLMHSFKRLALLRAMQGYDVGLVAIEDILAGSRYGNKDIISGIEDDAGKLRTFLIYAFEHWGTKYVLLGGNSDIIPVRYGTGRKYNAQLAHNFDDGSIPSDLYYSDLNSNWNTDNRNDFYGKESDNLDYCPELYVGRLLCRNAEEVDNYIDKLEVYEMKPGNGDPSYLMSVTETFQKDFIHQKDLINKEFGKLGYTYNNIFIETDTEPVVGSDVISSINENVCGVFSHHGHANPRALHTTRDSLKFYHNIYALDWQKNLPSENYEDVENGLNNLTNRNKPFIMQSLGCNTAPLDHYHPIYFPDTCTLAQSFTMGRDYGGVIYLGNSRPGYYNPSASKYPSQVDRYTIYVMQTFWDLVSNGVKTVGEAEALCKCPHYSPNLNKQYAHDIRLTYHLIGDPLIKIWTSLPKPDMSTDKNDLSKDYTIFSLPFNGPVGRKISASEIDNQQNCAIYFMPDNDDRLPIFTNLTIPNFNFTGENVLYCENLCLGSETGKTTFSGDADITFRSFGSVSLDNVIISDNAVVTIITTGDVDLKTIKVSPNGYLRIRCNRCNSGALKSTGRIEIYEYDPATKRSSPYKGAVTEPMVVEGRSWEYIESSQFSNDRFLQKIALRIEGESIIDGQQYAVVNAYVSGQPAPIQGKPYCYLRETLDGRVYARTNPDYVYLDGHIDAFGESQMLKDGDEFLLADFNDFYASQTFYPQWVYGDERLPLETYEYTNAINTLNVWQLRDAGLRLVEKVGYVWPDYPCGLLTPVYRFPAGDNGYFKPGWLYLQRVQDAGGNIIYEIDNMYSSEICVAADDMPFTYYDLQGRKLNPDALSPGIYIRQQGGTSTKVLIK